MLPFSFFITSIFCVFIVLIKKHFEILVITKISKRKQSHLDSIINRENNGPGARLSKAPEAYRVRKPYLKTVGSIGPKPGTIIGDGDLKRAPFPVLGLSPWYGTIFLFLEQIAPSPAAHARTRCEDFCGCCVGEMASEIPDIFHVFGPQLIVFTSVGILLKYFRRKLLQFEWSKTVSNLGMFRFTLRYNRWPSCVPTDASFTWAVHYHSLNFTYVED